VKTHQLSDRLFPHEYRVPRFGAFLFLRLTWDTTGFDRNKLVRSETYPKIRATAMRAMPTVKIASLVVNGTLARRVNTS
jgi:hypothetical protein